MPTQRGQTIWLDSPSEGRSRWPHCSESASPLEAVEGGGGVAAKVVELEGAIGYSALPDTKAKGATAALLEEGKVNLNRMQQEIRLTDDERSAMDDGIQALTKLGQTGQACKAYGELDAVYGAKIRPDLKKLETDAKTEANCS